MLNLICVFLAGYAFDLRALGKISKFQLKYNEKYLLYEKIEKKTVIVYIIQYYKKILIYF